MNLVAAIDEEIDRLKQAKAILSEATTKRGPHHMSDDARRRIADAQRKRWAKLKKKTPA
jgi:hypothetical protein